MRYYGLHVLCLMVLGGCASFDGAPQPITAADLTSTAICPSDDQLRAYAGEASARDGMSKADYRDAKISTCIAVIDAKFAEFLAALRRQRISTSLGGDLTLLTLTGVAAVASHGTANALAAASAGVVGAKVAIDKDLYFEQTLPALEAAMEANRSSVLLRIRSQQSGKAPYSLADARADIRAYEAAGSVDAAIKGLTTLAAKAETTAADKVAAFAVVALSDDDSDRQDRMVDFVRGLESAGDTATLTQIASALKLAVTGTPSAITLRKAILRAIVQSPANKTFSETYAAVAAIAATKGKELGP